MKNFRDLQIWNRSHGLTLDIYRITQSFPSIETYGLLSQMRRSVSSIPTNIAEGCGRSTDKDFARFLDMAMGSASELEYQLILACDLRYISAEIFETTNAELTEIKRMLNAFIQKLRANR
ncbi:MAG: diversity-generating retroelement protein bAvd family protein [Verrucomicrobiales bacterium]|nr:diversity-generating retroelement protein bAvd family protein [Verrucomicrobiales bacterium]